jgi:hypothetical protein
MKRLLSIIVVTALVAVVMTACNRSPATNAETKPVLYDDTVGLAQFQAWKMINERVDPMMYNQPVYNQSSAPVKQAARRSTSTPKASSGTMSSTSTNQAKVKKGWSKSAKYSVIGGVAGGVAGAVINKKNRVVGGVIGAVIGAGGGYAIGRSQDKKDGRIPLQ